MRKHIYITEAETRYSVSIESLVDNDNVYIRILKVGERCLLYGELLRTDNVREYAKKIIKSWATK